MKTPVLSAITALLITPQAFSVTTVIILPSLTPDASGSLLNASTGWAAQTAAGSFTTSADSGIASATGDLLRSRYTDVATTLAVGDRMAVSGQYSYTNTGSANNNADFTAGIGDPTEGLGAAVVSSTARFQTDFRTAGIIRFRVGSEAYVTPAATYTLGDLLEWNFVAIKTATADEFFVGVTINNLTQGLTYGSSSSTIIDAGITANGAVPAFQTEDLGGGTLNVHFTPIPEPASTALLLLAAFGLGARRRR